MLANLLPFIVSMNSRMKEIIAVSFFPRSKPPEILPSYCVKDVNLGDVGTEDSADKTTVGSASDETLLSVIAKVEEAFSKIPQVEERILDNMAVVKEIENNPSYGPSVLKHLKQNSSLIGNLEKAGLLKVRNDSSILHSLSLLSGIITDGIIRKTGGIIRERIVNLSLQNATIQEK